MYDGGGVGEGVSVGISEYTHNSKLDYTTVPKGGEEMWPQTGAESEGCD